MTFTWNDLGCDKAVLAPSIVADVLPATVLVSQGFLLVFIVYKGLFKKCSGCLTHEKHFKVLVIVSKRESLIWKALSVRPTRWRTQPGGSGPHSSPRFTSCSEWGLGLTTEQCVLCTDLSDDYPRA